MNNYKIKLTKLASELKPKHLKFANAILKGKSQEQAYIDAGYSPSGAVASASRLLTNANIKKYLELSKQKAKAAAQETLVFDEYQWLLTQKRILAMALGDTKIKKHLVVADEAIEIEVKETNLATANKAQELIARRMGWLTDNKKIQQEPISFHIDLS